MILKRDQFLCLSDVKLLLTILMPCLSKNILAF